MNAEEFFAVTGHMPEGDDLERANCAKAGETGHWHCGVCVCGMPRFVCGHSTKLTERIDRELTTNWNAGLCGEELVFATADGRDHIEWVNDRSHPIWLLAEAYPSDEPPTCEHYSCSDVCGYVMVELMRLGFPIDPDDGTEDHGKVFDALRQVRFVRIGGEE